MTASLFYITGLIALIATCMALTRANATHALLYLIVSLLALAVLSSCWAHPLPARCRS